MINPELYNRTVNILVDAYFKDTLQHGNCYACAVGNLVCANMGYKFISKKKNINNTGIRWEANNKIIDYLWANVHTMCGKDSEFFRENYKGVAKIQIDSTGYKPRETQKIEKAFENAKFGDSEEDYMFNGLMAVIDVLDQIHENTDTQTTTLTKSKFNKNLSCVI